MHGSPKAERSTAYLLLAVLAVVWGSSFILMKRGLETYTPFQVGAIRISVAFLCMLPFLIFRVKNIPKDRWKYLAAVGILGNGIPAVLFPLAETQLSSALAGMLNSLTPLFTFIVGISLFKMRFTQNRLAGLIIGLIGAGLLVAGKQSGHAESNVVFASLIILATIFYGFSVNIMRNKLAGLDAVTITAGALLCSGVPMLICLFSTDFMHRIVTISGAPKSFIYVLILGAMGTAFSTILFVRLVKISGALLAASVTYLIPIVAVGWGFIDGESLSAIHIVALAAILMGVYLINKTAAIDITKGKKGIN